MGTHGLALASGLHFEFCLTSIALIFQWKATQCTVPYGKQPWIQYSSHILQPIRYV